MRTGIKNFLYARRVECKDGLQYFRGTCYCETEKLDVDNSGQLKRNFKEAQANSAILEVKK